MAKKIKGKPHSLKKKKNTLHRSFFQPLIYILLSIIFSLLFIYVPALHTSITSLGEWGYVGAFIGGMFFVSVFTAAPATIVLLALAETHSLFPLAILAGFGSVIGDFVIMSVMTHHGKEMSTILPEGDGISKTIRILRHTKYRLALSILGAIIVASPLPDELGLALMGLGKIPWPKLAVLIFFLDTIGIYILLTLR